ncbi:MAG TPA: amidophosphoribosyltransferase [Halanaerobiales bacterium]|nr:amidophosphoribosyltransferase [Halanaerobiales bacterium]
MGKCNREKDLKQNDKMEEECGIFGIYSPEKRDDIARLNYLGLHALQHRGQESAGICVNNDRQLKVHKGMGLVSNVFDKETLKDLTGNISIGHVRYSTTGSSLLVNAQPLLTNSIKGDLALAHNGNLINGQELKDNLESHGSIFHSTLDTEVIAHLVARSFKDDIIEALMQSLQQIKGAFSLIAMTNDSLIAARDPHGFRPLVLGKKDDSFILSSETCAFDIIDAEFMREIEPGEVLIINQEGITSKRYSEDKTKAFCVFEFIYFARPDSIIGGENVYLARKKMGRRLAKEMNIEADLVVPVPSSGMAAAQGYSLEAGISYADGILRNRYVGRTFIQPTQEMRDLKVRMKLNPINKILEGKDIILVDDSIVRGTTSKQIINRLKETDVNKIHMAIASPPVKHPCFYGLDTSRRQELIAREKEVEEIAEYIGADSLHYLSLEGILSVLEADDYGYCSACFNGKYPTDENEKREVDKNGFIL